MNPWLIALTVLCIVTPAAMVYIITIAGSRLPDYTSEEDGGYWPPLK